MLCQTGVGTQSALRFNHTMAWPGHLVRQEHEHYEGAAVSATHAAGLPSVIFFFMCPLMVGNAAFAPGSTPCMQICYQMVAT